VPVGYTHYLPRRRAQRRQIIDMCEAYAEQDGLSIVDIKIVALNCGRTCGDEGGIQAALGAVGEAEPANILFLSEVDRWYDNRLRCPRLTLCIDIGLGTARV
jgi:hypothetical protein